MRFRKQKQIIVVVDENARREAGDFLSIHNCYIATAIKQKFGKKTRVCVDSSGATINNVDYKILGDNGSCRIVERAADTNCDLAVVLNRID